MKHGIRINGKVKVWSKIFHLYLLYILMTIVAFFAANYYDTQNISEVSAIDRINELLFQKSESILEDQSVNTRVEAQKIYIQNLSVSYFWLWNWN